MNDMNHSERKRLGGAGGAFLAIGIVFFVLGLSVNPVFVGVGAAFIPLAVVFLAKSRRSGSG